jgi:hypothetical protein
MLLPAGVKAPFSTSSNSTGLFVGLTVYDTSGASPVLVSGPTLMSNYFGFCYQGSFIPTSGKQYLVVAAVYTDDTLSTINAGYQQQSWEVTAFTFPVNFGPVQSVVGIISCQEQLFPTPTFKIFLGDADTMYCRLVDSVFNPIDLTNCTEITANFPNADGSYATLLLTDSDIAITDPPVLGSFSIPLTSEITSLLNVGQYQDLNITFNIGGQTFTVPYMEALSVFEVT